MININYLIKNKEASSLFTSTNTTESRTEWQTALNHDDDARFRGDPLPSETKRVNLIRHDDRLHYEHMKMFSIVQVVSQRNSRAFRETRLWFLST